MVRLREVTDAMAAGDSFQCFFDRAADEVVWVAEDEFAAAEAMEDGADLAETASRTESGMVEALELAVRIVDDNGSSFVALPSQWDVHEYAIMQDFADSLPESEARQRILRGLRGSGAFRRFKDNVHRLGLADAWYAFRDERLAEIAREWAHENDIAVTP